MEPVRIGGHRGYLVDGRLYRTKRELAEDIRSILRAYKPGERVSVQHHGILLGLLAYHPEAEEKTRGGIAAFEVRAVPGYEHVSGFWAIRNDGAEVAWSYTKLINGPTKPLARFRKVCRDAVADQLLGFKLGWFEANAENGCFTCPVTGEVVPAERAHVDHVPPLTLDALVRTFAAERGLDLDKVGSKESLPENEETGIGRSFSDAALSAAWQAYHLEHARLRVVSDIANLSYVRRGVARRAG